MLLQSAVWARFGSSAIVHVCSRRYSTRSSDGLSSGLACHSVSTTASWALSRVLRQSRLCVTICQVNPACSPAVGITRSMLGLVDAIAIRPRSDKSRLFLQVDSFCVAICSHATALSGTADACRAQPMAPGHHRRGSSRVQVCSIWHRARGGVLLPPAREGVAVHANSAAVSLGPEGSRGDHVDVT